MFCIQRSFEPVLAVCLLAVRSCVPGADKQVPTTMSIWSVVYFLSSFIVHWAIINLTAINVEAYTRGLKWSKNKTSTKLAFCLNLFRTVTDNGPI